MKMMFSFLFIFFFLNYNSIKTIITLSQQMIEYVSYLNEKMREQAELNSEEQKNMKDEFNRHHLLAQ